MRNFAVISFVGLAGCSSPQSDIQMQRHFEQNKTYFSALVTGAVCSIENEKMLLWRDDIFKTNPACARLLDKVGARGIGNEGFSGGIAVYLSELNYSSHQKGYVFSTGKVTPQYLSLDQKPDDLQPYARGYKKIDENWYIYYEYSN